MSHSHDPNCTPRQNTRVALRETCCAFCFGALLAPAYRQLPDCCLSVYRSYRWLILPNAFFSGRTTNRCSWRVYPTHIIGFNRCHSTPRHSPASRKCRGSRIGPSRCARCRDDRHAACARSVRLVGIHPWQSSSFHHFWSNGTVPVSVKSIGSRERGSRRSCRFR